MSPECSEGSTLPTCGLTRLALHDTRPAQAPRSTLHEEIEMLPIPVGEVYSERFLAELRVLGTRLALELARPVLRELHISP